MNDVPPDASERLALCDSLERLGPGAPTLIEGWSAQDLAAHLVLRERDPIAGPCMVLPGPFQRFAARRGARLAQRRGFGWLIARLGSGPPPGPFRLGWVRSFPSLNDLFVHHEDLRRANGFGPRDLLTPALEAALWRNVRRGGRYLSRRLPAVGLEARWAGTDQRVTLRRPRRSGAPTAQLTGPPGELLLYLFGRRSAARVELTGPADAVTAVRDTHFGM